MRRVIWIAVALSVTAHNGSAEQEPTGTAAEKPVLLAYLCSNVTGSIMAAPNWKAEPDGMSNQQVLLKYRGNREIAEASWTMGTQAPYYEAVGIGVSMRSGFWTSTMPGRPSS